MQPILVVIGTRPEAIKLVPVVLALRARGASVHLLSTGQHREMLLSVLDAFDLTPDQDLEIMTPDQGLAGLSAAILSEMTPVLEKGSPPWVVVQGDTTTVAMVSLAAFYRRLPVAHVEAGLRTHERYDPFPEEMNRSLMGRLATRHFAPTDQAYANLLAEGVEPGEIEMVGNTVIDSLYRVRDRLAHRSFRDVGLDIPQNRQLVLVTGHRRENFGDRLRSSFLGLRKIAQELADQVHLVYPVHRNPNVQEAAHEILAGVPNIQLLEPLGYEPFLKLMTEARLIITDSGGVQEEATALGIPTLVTRLTSERPEAMESGVAELVGTDCDRVARAALNILRDPEEWRKRARPCAVFGDGQAAERIAESLLRNSP